MQRKLHKFWTRTVLKKKVYPMLQAPTHCGVWGRVILGSLSLVILLCKEADSSPEPITVLKFNINWGCQEHRSRTHQWKQKYLNNELGVQHSSPTATSNTVRRIYIKQEKSYDLFHKLSDFKFSLKMSSFSLYLKNVCHVPSILFPLVDR
jgi:hypothetical protein